MAMRLDHLAIACTALDEGVAWAEAALGVPFALGGAHARYGTHNRLLGLAGGLYLEVIAVDPQAVPEALPRWFGLDQFAGPPRLANWIVRVDDLDAALAAFPECGAAVAMQRGDLRWRISVPEDGGLPLGAALPTLLHWDSPPPGGTLPASGVSLHRLELRHPEIGRLQARLEPWLEDPRIHFEPSAEPGLGAVLETPKGEVAL